MQRPERARVATIVAGDEASASLTEAALPPADPDDRFMLAFHATSLDIWQLLLERLTVSEAHQLKYAMTLAAMTSRAPPGQPVDLTTSSGRETYINQAILGGECTSHMFVECYLKSVASVSFQRYRPELLFRLGKLYEAHDAKKLRKGALQFRDFPALRSAIEGPDMAANKPPITSYTERPMVITAVDFAPVAWEEDDTNVGGQADVIPASLQVFSLAECSNLQYHPHLEHYTFAIQNAVMVGLIDYKAQQLLIQRVLHGHHRAPAVTALHVPQNKILYTASADRTICAWLCEAKYSFDTRSRLPSAPTALAFDTVSQTLLAGATDGCVYVLPIIPKLGTAVRKVPAHTDWCMSIVTLPDLEQIATCGLDGKVKIWTSTFELRTTKGVREDREAKRPRSAQFEYDSPNSPKSGPSTSNGSGLTHMSFSASQKMIFAVEGGRSINCWNVFLPSPSDVLRLHEKPIAGTVSFRSSQEFISADTSGRVAIWDMYRTVVTQRLGGPESEYAVGTINSVAYDPSKGSVAVLGSKLSLFVPEQGTFSPMFELPVYRSHYAKVSRTIVVPTGNRVVVMDLLTSTTRNVLAIGTEEISSSALAAGEHILLGTTEGTVYYTPLAHWRPVTVARLDDAVVGVFDLGANSRAGAQGEENSRVLTVTRTSNIAHMAFGNLTGAYARAPTQKARFLSLDLVQFTAFSKTQFILYGASDEYLEAFDVAFSHQKMSERMPMPIVAMTCVDEIAGLFLALVDGSVRVYNSGSVLHVATVRPSQAPRAPLETGSNTIRQLIFNANTCSMAVLRDQSVKCFSCDRLVQGMQRFQHDTAFTPSRALLLLPNEEAEAYAAEGDAALLFTPRVADEGSDMGTVRSLTGLVRQLDDEDRRDTAIQAAYTLSVDLGTYGGDNKPLTFACRWQGKDRTVVVSEMDSAGVERCVERLVELKRWWLQIASDPIGVALRGGKARPRTFMKPLKLGEDAGASVMEESTRSASMSQREEGADAGRGLMSLAEAYIILPHHIHIPTTQKEELLDGMCLQAVYSICDPLPRRGAVAVLEQSTLNHRVPLGKHTVDSLRWLAISVGSALFAIHSTGHVALFSQGSIRYVCPNYMLCLQSGLFKQTDGNVPEPRERRSDSLFRFNTTLSNSLPAGFGRTLDDGRRQVPDIQHPPEGMDSISPMVDMWLLGLALFRAAAGRSYDASTGHVGGRQRDPNALAGLFDRQVHFIHPSIRHDNLIMVMLRGLLDPQPASRMTALVLLRTASQYGEGVRRVVHTMQEAEAVVVGATLVEDATPTEDMRKHKNNDSMVTFDQQLPSVVISTKMRRQSTASTMLGLLAKAPDTTPDTMSTTALPNHGHGDITLLQFAPPAHLRVPTIPNPIQHSNAAKRLATEVEYDALAVCKVGSDAARQKQRLLSTSVKGAPAGGTLALTRATSNFCKPMNDSIASGPIHYYPVLKAGMFTSAIFIESLQLFLVAEYDKSMGINGCSYLTLRSNLAPSSYAHALAEYYRKTAQAWVGNNITLFRTADPGPARDSPYASLVVAIYPPNNSVQCLGGVEQSDVEAAVIKRAGQGSVAGANKRDSTTVEGQNKIANRAYNDSDGSEDSSDESGTEGLSMAQRRQRKAKRLDRHKQQLAKDEALVAVTTDTIDEEFQKLQKQSQYKPERLCPFFTDTQAAAEAMGIVSTVPPPDLFYMKGWHRDRPMSRLRDGKTADPMAPQLRSPALSPLRQMPTTDAKGQRLPPLARLDHTAPLRKPISVHKPMDPLLCVTRSTPKKRK